MNNALVTFTFAGLSANYCFTTPERFALDIAAGLQGSLPGTYSTFVVSQNEPVTADRDKVWIQLDASDIPTGRNFRYASGGWFTRHPRRQDGEPWQDERVWWVGTEAAIQTWDGGNTDPVSTTTGPMWEIDHDFDARFPLAAGTTAKPTTFNVGDVGGEEDHTIVANEMPAAFTLSASLPGHRTNTETLAPQWLAPSGSAYASVTTPATEIGTFPFTNTGGGQEITNLPPYRVGFWLKPTIRIYLRP